VFTRPEQVLNEQGGRRGAGVQFDPRARQPPTAMSTPPAPANATPIGALERGDWRSALALLRNARGVGASLDPRLGAELRAIARSMANRAAGDHVRAEFILSGTARNLHQHWPILRLANHGDLVRLARPAPPDPSKAAPPLYRIGLLAWREQNEIARLRAPIREPPPGLTEDQYTLVLAMVEYLCWVQFDPGTWLSATPDDEAAVVEVRVHELIASPRDGLLRSATDMRRLRGQTAGPMTRAVWDRTNKYLGLRRLAMAELARRPRPPWTATDGPAGIAPRTGALLAWTAAQEAVSR